MEDGSTSANTELEERVHQPLPFLSSHLAGAGVEEESLCVQGKRTSSLWLFKMIVRLAS